MIQEDPKTKILITVGTTQFDGLISYTDSAQFISLILQAGYKQHQILYQYGTTGNITPTHPNKFQLHPDIQSIYDSHQVIISHGGAGTLLSCLKGKRRIIAVANTTLAGNHQIQLIEKLQQEGYILGFDSVQSFRKGRKEVLQLLKGEAQLKSYERANKSLLNSLVFGDDF